MGDTPTKITEERRGTTVALGGLKRFTAAKHSGESQTGEPHHDNTQVSLTSTSHS